MFNTYTFVRGGVVLSLFSDVEHLYNQPHSQVPYVTSLANNSLGSSVRQTC